ncbi:MAG: ribonuclease regulator [Vibrio gallaecicus]
MRRILFLVIFVAPSVCFANQLPLLPGQDIESPHKLFISSQNTSNDNFDVWQVDGGYSYNVFNNVDLYVGARINTSSLKSENGFLSGVSYQLTEKVSVKSAFHTYNTNNENENVVTAEVSSRMRVTDNLDIHATLDYEEWQKGIEVGLGFRF